MEYSTINNKIELENFLYKYLNYPVISKMKFNEYKVFVFFLFEEVNKLKINRLKIENVMEFVNNHFSEFYEDSDEIYERRFSFITEELVGFCADPRFWFHDFNDFKVILNKFVDGHMYKK
jgi:hypothetical protein